MGAARIDTAADLFLFVSNSRHSDTSPAFAHRADERIDGAALLLRKISPIPDLLAPDDTVALCVQDVEHCCIHRLTVARCGPLSQDAGRREVVHCGRERFCVSSVRDSSGELDTAALVAQHGGLVRHIAQRLRAKLKLFISVDDLVQMGMIGLIEAAQRYDESHGVPLGTYAYYRIRGAMIDGLKEATGVSRGQVKAILRLRAANEAAESAAWGGSTEQDDAAAVQEQVFATVFVMDLAELRESADEVDVIAEGTAHRADAENILSYRQQRDLIGKLLDRLEPDTQKLLREHYLHDRSLAEIGETMGISRSWASRLHTRGLRELRKIYEEHEAPQFLGQ